MWTAKKGLKTKNQNMLRIILPLVLKQAGERNITHKTWRRVANSELLLIITQFACDDCDNLVHNFRTITESLLFCYAQLSPINLFKKNEKCSNIKQMV